MLGVLWGKIMYVSFLHFFHSCTHSLAHSLVHSQLNTHSLTHTYLQSNLLFWLFQECDLNGIQLGGMVSPHPPLAINKPLQDQQAKQDCVHLPEDLWKEGEGGGGGKRLREE